ncbi:Filamentous hemagglutinin [Carex littledalei]|uniref:Filamentous hemagglutinin n=1 Tax=Carex littledalei TaxID=544730 RepID=A0A833RXX8_9POAL|nr:Filamentous hemagglutinin [Carex littledalei]
MARRKAIPTGEGWFRVTSTHQRQPMVRSHQHSSIHATRGARPAWRQKWFPKGQLHRGTSINDFVSQGKLFFPKTPSPTNFTTHSPARLNRHSTVAELFPCLYLQPINAINGRSHIPLKIELWIRGVSRDIEVSIISWDEEPCALPTLADHTPTAEFFQKTKQENIQATTTLARTSGRDVVSVDYDTLLAVFKTLRDGPQKDNIEQSLRAAGYTAGPDGRKTGDAAVRSELEVSGHQQTGELPLGDINVASATVHHPGLNSPYARPHTQNTAPLFQSPYPRRNGPAATRPNIRPTLSLLHNSPASAVPPPKTQPNNPLAPNPNTIPGQPTQSPYQPSIKPNSPNRPQESPDPRQAQPTPVPSGRLTQPQAQPEGTLSDPIPISPGEPAPNPTKQATPEPGNCDLIQSPTLGPQGEEASHIQIVNPIQLPSGEDEPVEVHSDKKDLEVRSIKEEGQAEDIEPSEHEKIQPSEEPSEEIEPWEEPEEPEEVSPMDDEGADDLMDYELDPEYTMEEEERQFLETEAPPAFPTDGFPQAYRQVDRPHESPPSRREFSDELCAIREDLETEARLREEEEAYISALADPAQAHLLEQEEQTYLEAQAALLEEDLVQAEQQGSNEVPPDQLPMNQNETEHHNETTIQMSVQNELRRSARISRKPPTKHYSPKKSRTKKQFASGPRKGRTSGGVLRHSGAAGRQWF